MGRKLWLVLAVISVNRKDLGIVSGIPFPEALLTLAVREWNWFTVGKKKKYPLLPPVTNIQKWSQFIIWDDRKSWDVVVYRRRIIKNWKSMLLVYRRDSSYIEQLFHACLVWLSIFLMWCEMVFLTIGTHNYVAWIFAF